MPARVSVGHRSATVSVNGVETTERDGSATGERVLVVLASSTRRGAEIEGERLARELVLVGVDATAVALATGGGDGPRVDVPVLGPKPLAMQTLRKLRRQARSADVVIAYGSMTLPACAIALCGSGVPFIYRSIGDPVQWVRSGFHRERTGLLMRRAARVVALWDGAADEIQRLYRVNPDRIAVIPNARSATEFRPPTPEERAGARSDLGIADDTTLAVVVGSLSEEKRVDLAISAVSRLENTDLVVVGEGPMRADLEALGQRLLGSRVCFLGALPDVRPVYRAADVLVLSSRTEGMPGVAIEAGLSGVPVAACDVGAMSWLIEHSLTGALCVRGATAEELAGAIERACSGRLTSGSLEALLWESVNVEWQDQINMTTGHAARHTKCWLARTRP